MTRGGLLEVGGWQALPGGPTEAATCRGPWSQRERSAERASPEPPWGGPSGGKVCGLLQGQRPVRLEHAQKAGGRAQGQQAAGT